MKVNNIILVLLIFSFSDNYLKAILGFSFFDDIANILILVLGLIYMLNKQGVNQLKNKTFTLLFLFYILIAFMFLLVSINAFFYELYKLLVFLFFIPIVSSLNTESIKNLEKNLLKFFLTLLFINSFVIVLQYIISPNITTIFGVSNVYIDRADNMNRMSGLFENVNIYGDLCLLIYLFNEIISKNRRYRLLKILSIISILISTSKHAIIGLLIILIIQNYKLIYKNIAKGFYLIIIFISIGFFAYTINQKSIENKITSYTYLFSKTEDLNGIDEGRIEGRGQNLIDGINIMKRNNFHGNGLGTWGDYSSTFSNENNIGFENNTMSDSSLIHILVEQGYVSILYFLLLFSGIFSVSKKYKKFFLLLMFSYLIFITVTMGFSSGSWPILFSYIYIRLLYSKTLPIE